MKLEHLDDDLLSGHLDGALAAAEDTAVTVHLAECAACARDLERLHRVSAAVRGLGPVAPLRPLDLDFALEPASPQGTVRRRVPQWAYALVGAAAVIAIGLPLAANRLGAQHPGPGVGTTALRVGGSEFAPGTSASSPGSAAALDSRVPTLSGNAGAQNLTAPPAAGSPAERRPASIRTFSGEFTILSVSASPGQASVGTAVSLRAVMQARRDLDFAGLTLTVRNPDGTEVELGSVNATQGKLSAGESIDLAITWSAGGNGEGGRAGDYMVIVRGRATPSGGGTAGQTSVEVGVRAF